MCRAILLRRRPFSREDDSDVVARFGIVDPARQMVGHHLDQIVERRPGVLQQQLAEAGRLELLAGGVFRLGDAIAEDGQKISRIGTTPNRNVVSSRRFRTRHSAVRYRRRTNPGRRGEGSRVTVAEATRIVVY